MGWIEFLLAYASFLASHVIPIRPPVKPWLVSRLGARGFTWLYSGLSLAILIWLIKAANRAPYVELWAPRTWHKHLTLVVMLVFCLFLMQAIGRPNPFSFGGANNSPYTPERPGIVRITRHPVLLSLALWAGAHTLANGDLAHVVLFGGFFGFSVFGMKIIDRRKKQAMGPNWTVLWDSTRSQPYRQALERRTAEGTRLVLGLLLYAGLLMLHSVFAGVAIAF